MAFVFCNACGHRNPEGANFCSSCGAPLDRVAGDDERTITFLPVDPAQDSILTYDDVTIDLATLPAGTGVLVVRSGPEAGLRFALTRPVTNAGRHPESELFLDDVTVSRRHARIDRTPQGYEVVDAGSLNGTYLNRKRIERAPLRNGDELQIGKFRLVFLDGPDART
jgi:pSer/pThr/pTyr-binding forkhead associated (FHA) protein